MAESGSKPRRKDAWFTRADLCRIFDVTEQTFDRSIRPRIDQSRIRRIAGKVLYFARGIIDDRAASASSGETSNPKNLALDDYRGERTALARLERMEREGSLVRIEVVRQKLLRVAEVLRAANATLQRQFGHDAYSLIEEAILALLAEFLLRPGDAAPSGEHPRG